MHTEDPHPTISMTSSGSSGLFYPSIGLVRRRRILPPCVRVCVCVSVRVLLFVGFVIMSHATQKLPNADPKILLLRSVCLHPRCRRSGSWSPLCRPNSRRVELAPKNLHIGRAPFARRPNHTTVDGKHDILECAMELLLFEE